MSALLSWTDRPDCEIIAGLLTLHSPCAAPRILDATANRGHMWAGSGYSPLVRVDLDQETQRPDVWADCRELPFAAGSFDVVTFDPPHIPGKQRRLTHKPAYQTGYGLGMVDHVGQFAVAELFAPFLAEAARVLVPGGIVLAKLANPVYWDDRLWHTHHFWAAVQTVPGLKYCDEQVKVRPAAMPQPHATQYHTLSAHSTWMVVRKGGCQGHGVKRPIKLATLPMFADGATQPALFGEVA